MSLSKLLEIAEKLALSEAKEHSIPSTFHVKYSFLVGQRLAESLGANKEIVGVGNYLMDCMLGKAFTENRQSEHVQMSLDKAKEILLDFPELVEDIKKNILACINEHHGAEKFYSLESEICCNADCYRFSSIEGFVGGIHNGRNMPVEKLLELYASKANEKWELLSLDMCKEELKPQYSAIKDLISSFKKANLK